MRNVGSILVLLLAMLGFTAAQAGDLHINGTSAATTEAGIRQMMVKHDEGPAGPLMMALFRIQFAKMKSASELANNPAMQGVPDYAYLAPMLDGLTYREILDMASKSPTKAYVTPSH